MVLLIMPEVTSQDRSDTRELYYIHTFRRPTKQNNENTMLHYAYNTTKRE